ncbi:MAG TPA: caspase family protein, partial [Steroidobacteraceae bacterium]
YATALQVWLPQANAGDAQAQTYVGEIYEKGLGLPPDYARAAEWYRKAADQGYSRALSNLAYLYEKGLGVPQDAVMALNLYRKAAGLTEDELVFASEVAAVQSQLDEAVAKLEAQTAEANRLRADLDATRAKLSEQLEALALSHKEVDRLKAQLNEARASSDAARLAQVQKLEAEVAAREARLQQQRAEVEALEKSASARASELEKQLAAASSQDAALRRQLGEQTAQAASLRAQLAAAEERVRATEQRVQELSEQLKAEREALARERAQVAQRGGGAAEIEQLKQRLREREALLAQQNKLIATLQQQKKNYESEISRLRAQLLAQERHGSQQALEIRNVRAQLASAEQRLLQTQQQVARATEALEAERAQLAREREELNRRAAAATAEQLKEAQRLASQLAEREAQIIEQRAQIAALEAQRLEYEEQISRLRAAPANQTVALRDSAGTTASLASLNIPRLKLPRELQVGTYHALIIGNNKYQFMPGLESAVSDAQAIDKVLRERYGFKTRVLLNATRGEILSALNEYRVTLKERDNLLIYYAGHGELDAKNQRGYWLPVNARRDDTTEWISDSMITDQIALMQARHVLVVADSCYSGAMTRSSGVRIVGDGSEAAELKRLVKLARLPSRTVLTSGGEQPVLDGGSGSNSIFAAAFIDVLTRNEGVLEGSRLYSALFDPVKAAAARFNIEQSPRYSMLADAGHLNGEFLFVPATT